MNDFTLEILKARKAINELYDIYPKITILTNRYVNALGNTKHYQEEYIITFNPITMSLETVHHEFAHVVQLELNGFTDHGTEFQEIMCLIKECCQNENL